MNKDIQLIKETYQSYLNAIEMLKERDYNINDDKTLSIDSFSKKFEEVDIFKLEYEHNKLKKSIYFSILKEKKITKKDFMNKIKDLLEESEHDNYLFITSDAQPLSYVNEIKTKFNIDIQIFTIDKLQINILKHILQPDEIILYNLEDTKKIMEEKQWKSEDIPKILSSDAISMYFNAKEGELFKFYRKSMVDVNRTSSQGIYYRIVV